MSAGLSLVVPGLLGPWPELARAPVDADLGLPQLPVLERLLSRARRGPERRGRQALLFRLAGLAPEPGSEPVAPVARLGEGAAVEPAEYWLRLDPVTLEAGIRHVTLVGRPELTAEQADDLAGRLAEHFAADGWRIEALAPGRWYLGLAEAPQLAFPDPDAALGAAAQGQPAALPQGPDAALWRRHLTEAQMLLHEAPANQARAEAGQPLANGVWPWGGGRLPAPGRPQFARVAADDPLARGLARLADRPAAPCPDRFEQLAQADGTLVVLEGPGQAYAAADPVAWAAALQALERDWLAPALAALDQGQLAAIHLHSADGRRFQVERAGAGPWLRRLWPRRRPLRQWL